MKRLTRGGASSACGALHIRHVSPPTARSATRDASLQPTMANGQAIAVEGQRESPRTRDPPSRTSSISSRASPMSCSGAVGSFSRHRRSSRRSLAASSPAARPSPARVSTSTAERVGDVVALERSRAGQHLVQHAAKRPDVGALVDRSARAPAPDSCRPPCRGSCPPASSPAW